MLYIYIYTIYAGALLTQTRSDLDARTIDVAQIVHWRCRPRPVWRLIGASM